MNTEKKFFIGKNSELFFISIFIICTMFSSSLISTLPMVNELEGLGHLDHDYSQRSDNRKHHRTLHEQDKKAYGDELKRAKKIFTKLDKLYKKTKVKIQKINDKHELGPELVSNLYLFLSGTSDVDTIKEIIKKDCKINLKNKEIKRITSINNINLVNALRELYKMKIIDEVKLYELILSTAPMTWPEILKLFDLGASKTQSGFLVQLKTGEKFGDPIELFEEFHTIANEITIVDSERENNSESLLFHSLSPDTERSLRDLSPRALDIVSDARVISEIRRHFVFLSSLNVPISFRPGTTDFRLNALTTSAPVVNPVNSNAIVWASLRNLNAVFSSNHYFANHNTSLTNSVMIAPFAATYWGSYNWTAGGVGWWLSYTTRYLGAGASYTANFSNGTFWSHGAPTYLMIGGMISGWRNNLSAGISLMTMMSSTIGAGASIWGTLTRDHDVNYQGIYPLDGRFAEIRGKHKIEIDDRKGVSGKVAVAVNFSNLKVPILVAFRAGPEFTSRRIYRTHVDLPDAQRMLTESEIPGVLFLLGKQIKESKIPKFDDPRNLNVGDEFIETKTGKLSGAFVAGLQSQIPIGAVRFGATIDLTAEFELALRRLPANKFEVSIKPKRIYEIGIISSALNTLGVGYIDSMSIYKKQSFIFDFDNPDSVVAYYDLVENGRLPSPHEIQIYSENRGPEYLLSEFRYQNEQLKNRGVALSFVEHVEVSSQKLSAGFNSRLLKGVMEAVSIAHKKLRPTHDRLNLQFAGIDWQYMQADAASTSSDGIIAISNFTSAFRKSVGQGFSGRFNRDLYLSHRRIYTIDDSKMNFSVNKWQFDSLLIHGQFEDNLITDDQENDIVREINDLFGTAIGSFEAKDSRQIRKVNIERELSVAHLELLSQDECRERIYVASQVSGIPQIEIYYLLETIRGKHPDKQALILKQFIQVQSGLNGFAAIHQLLGAKPEDLVIRAESGYANTIDQAKKFIITHTKEYNEENEPIALLNPMKSAHTLRQWKNKRATKKFYDQSRNNLRNIDQQLRLLYDDKYLLDENSDLVHIYGKERVDKIIEKGFRQDKSETKLLLVSARKTIKNMLDLENQGYSEQERKSIYKMAGRRHLSLEALVDKLMLKYENMSLAEEKKNKRIKKRFEKSIDLIEKINDRINRVSEDHVMIAMDKDYVENFIDQLKNMKKKLISIIDLRGFEHQVVVGIKSVLDKEVYEHYETIILLYEIDNINEVLPAGELKDNEVAL
ncbi:MAG: hypothetical protein KC505_06680 [Myxococcales bacterium]|nr:hypothetical protein [Myxococcales bacterium]USN49927.1 MAG: hypothetical protein H6731_06500 [Myxococcales bacterium]